jgi:hypothetical protein
MRTGSGRPNITCQNLGCYHAGTWRLNLRCIVSSAISQCLQALRKVRLSAEEPRPGGANRTMERRASSPAHPARHERARRLSPTLGLCARQNCPMLETVADPDGGCAPRIEVGDSSRGSFSLQLSTMRRLTARLLLLVLFAGTLAPLVAAASVPSQHEHCVRTPLAVQTQSTPSCHHQVAAGAHEPSPSGPISKNNLHSNPCCTGHECCRPLARALWAQVSLHSPSQRTGRTSDRVLAFQPHVRTLEFAAYHSVRAPPAL